jgi:lipopolysaccharide export system protein LptA
MTAGARAAIFGFMLALLWPLVPASPLTSAALEAQVRPVTPAGRPAERTGSDTVPGQRELVAWIAADSVMLELLQRRGYVITRYQGDSVRFDLSRRILDIIGDPAAVQRGQSLVVGDSIQFNDATDMVRIAGSVERPAVLRDPSQQQADVTGERLTYNLATQTAQAEGVATVLESGELWYVSGGRATFVTDSLLDRRSFYGHEHNITSCDHPDPHYHFRVSEVKAVQREILVARPAVLYISDVPVMWLPFIFQDLRTGRRSGMLNPRVGASEIVRNNPGYRRTVENLGYYFALNDYTDASIWMDWRSGARPTEGDPGWVRTTGEFRYRWIDRFVTGRLALSHLSQNDGSKNSSLSLSHGQDFSQRSKLTANINYVTSTAVQRRTEFLPQRALATIASSANFQHRRGPFSMNLGGSRRQYPGMDLVDQSFPSLSISSRPIDVAPWLVWTPSLNIQNSQRINVDQTGPLGFRFIPRDDGGVDSVRVRGNTRNSSVSFDTPIQLFGVSLRNSFRVSDVENDYPQRFEVVNVRDTTDRSVRVFQRTFRSELDWSPSFSLPAISGGRWNVSPSVGIVNVDPGAFMVRSERTGGEWVRQSKRLQTGIGVSPTFFALFPGFGPFSRLRHSVSTQLSYSYAPAAQVSDEYLGALGRTRQGYLGSLPQSRLTLGFSQNIEARLRSPGDTAGEGRKLQLLALNFQSLTWDFERARATGRTGLVTDRFGVTGRSDLLPGLDAGVTYSLFQGSIVSDSARFSPFLENVRLSFSVNRQTNPFAIFTRVFGRAIPQTAPQLEQLDLDAQTIDAQEAAAQPVAGSQARNIAYDAPVSREWSLRLSFTSTRQRPPSGNPIVVEDDFAARCDAQLLSPIAHERCVQELQATQLTDPNADQLIGGGVFIRQPPRSSIQSSLNMPITQMWAGTWQTTYDFLERDFASHVVTLSRDLHDWRANFGFTQSPNGNFAFTFYISLKAQPELKFDYNLHNYRNPGGAR